jgi:hypothetical protein
MYELEEKIIENNKFRGQVQSYQDQVLEFENKISRSSKEKVQIF